MVRVTKYYNMDAGGEAGGTPPTDGDLTPEQIEKETAQLNDLLSKSDLSEEEKTTLETLKGKYEIEEVGEDGKPLTEEQKQEAKATRDKITALQAKKETELTAEEKAFLEKNVVKPEPKDVYKEVDELSGYPLEVEYGDVDPKSAEGILLREETIRSQTIEAYDQELKEKFPRGFQFLNHISRGGKEEDFFKPENKDFLSVKLTSKDTQGQENFYRTALALRGIKPEQIDALVTLAKDNNQLFDESNAELEALQSRQRAKLVAEEEEAEKLEQQKAQDIGAFNQLLGKTVEKGINGIPIPPKERRDFLQFVSSTLRYSGGKFLHVRTVDPSTLEKELATEYFRFKGGSLDKVATRQAESLNAKKFRNSINYKITPKTSGKAKSFVPMGDV